jgi:hypothetical protein
VRRHAHPATLPQEDAAHTHPGKITNQPFSLPLLLPPAYRTISSTPTSVVGLHPR